MKHTKVIVALGSNHRQEEHIGKATELMAHLLDDCQTTPCLWTQPIGIDSDRFLNTLATGTTTLTQEALMKQLKQLEQLLGDSREQRRKGIVLIDIDLLQYGTTKLKEEDWERPYIRELRQWIIDNS